MKNKLYIFIALGLLAVISCVKEPSGATELTPQLPASHYDYVTNAVNISGTSIFEGDFFLPTELNGHENPEVSDAGATLGRVLFYDKNLSINNTISCASCHKQENAFADPVASSTGFEGRKTPRNSSAIINAGMNDNLFWDSRAFSVVDLTLQPVQNHIEMGIENMETLRKKLSETPYYKELFKTAFGSEAISEAKIASAMSQFLCSMTSFNSKFDQAKTSNFSTYTELELLGKDIFFSDRAKCNQCHDAGLNKNGSGFETNTFNARASFFAPTGFDSPYGGSVKGTANIGLDIFPDDTGKENGNFKIPTLRNIQLTGPYMHDGRFNSLEEVINHYSDGIEANANLDEKFMNHDGSVIKMNFNEVEKKGLIAFLNTLTDTDYITDVRFSDPFKK